jgi:hypothetical protein
MGASDTDTGQKARTAADTAKKESQDLAQRAAGSTGQVAQTAKEEAKGVVQEATTEARDLAGKARTEVKVKFDDQRQRLSGALRTSGQELAQFARSEEQSQLTKELARRAGEYAQNVGDYLDRADTGRIFNDVRSFARRRPGTFLLVAAIGGVVVGRLTRSVMASQPSTGATNATSYEPSGTMTTTPGYGDGVTAARFPDDRSGYTSAPVPPVTGTGAGGSATGGLSGSGSFGEQPPGTGGRP